MITRKILVGLALAGLVVTSVGCSGNKTPKTAPEQAQAIGKLGYKALAGVEVIQRTVASLEAAHAPGVTEARAAEVMKLSYVAGGEGQKLADLLDAYVKLVDASKQIEMQGQISTAIAGFLDAVGKIGRVDLGGATGQIVQLVTNVVTTVDQLKAALADLKAAAVHSVLDAIARLVPEFQTPHARTSALLAR